jgi:propanol-preferring alcohol dehydrogenase
VIALAQAGSLHVETELFALSAAHDAFERLRTGQIHGRAVLVPALDGQSEPGSAV